MTLADLHLLRPAQLETLVRNHQGFLGLYFYPGDAFHRLSLLPEKLEIATGNTSVSYTMHFNSWNDPGNHYTWMVSSTYEQRVNDTACRRVKLLEPLLQCEVTKVRHRNAKTIGSVRLDGIKLKRCTPAVSFYCLLFSALLKSDECFNLTESTL